MKTLHEVIEEKLERFLLKNQDLYFGQITPLGRLRMGVLTERDLKLATVTMFKDSKHYSMRNMLHTHLGHLCTQYGGFAIIIDESVDDYYCEFERVEQPADNDKLRGMDPPISTLANFSGLLQNRKVGNTTRLADHAVQLILSGKVVQIKDHYEGGHNIWANKRLAEIVWNRLNHEHRGLPYEYDMTNSIIKIAK